MEPDLLFRHANLATMTSSNGIGEIFDGSVAVDNGKIAWIGLDKDIPADFKPRQELNLQGQWLTPGLIDCHTHIVWAGNRSKEFEMRLEGATYSEISKAGGGILATVNATRMASPQQLADLARPRIQDLISQGVTTIEIKTGYGLDLDTEVKMLKVARALGKKHIVRVLTTYLGAHALPPEYTGRPDDYIGFICDGVLPTLKKEALVDAVDAFCEQIAFSAAQVCRVFEKAQELGFQIKLHADQLTDSGGAGLIARLRGLSADHVEYSSEESVKAMGESGTVAVLLPGAYYSLRESKSPPIELFRQHNVSMAIATDSNPGTSPCSSLLLMMNMACTCFRLTPSEALAGVTKHAARALGLSNLVGELKVGMEADLATFGVDHPRDLAANIGMNPCTGRWLGGLGAIH